MTGEAEIKLAWKPTGKAGFGVLAVKVAGKPLFTQKLDIARSDSRDDFKSRVCERAPGIDREALTEQLEELAGSIVDDGDKTHAEKITQAQALTKLADGAELFHDGETAYSTVKVVDGAAGPHSETHAVKSQGFRDWLYHRYWKSYGKPAGGQGMQDAIESLSAKARHDGKKHRVWIRVARHGDEIYLDLCNELWQTVRVTRDGWQVVSDPPVKFMRRRGMLPLPSPMGGGKITDLRPLLNASDDATWLLIVAWLVGALRTEGPYAVLAVNGEQGSAKTTLCKMLRGLIDPHIVELRPIPRDERDLMIAANNSWIIALDNLSQIPTNTSDALCRIATGGGFATRELYSIGEEQLIHVTRPILFNGIEELATRPDLLERAIVLNLSSIPDASRQPESELWKRYEAERPRILGALLDAVAAALRNIDNVQLPSPPRMADFARWIVAAEPALPWSTGSFIDAYASNRAAANELALEASSVASALQAFIKENVEWDGTATELLSVIENERYANSKTRGRPGWPKSAKALSNQLRRIGPTLRRIGIEVTMGNREGRDRRRIIRVVYVPETPSALSASTIKPVDFQPVMATADGVDDEIPDFSNSTAAIGKR